LTKFQALNTEAKNEIKIPIKILFYEFEYPV